MRGTREIPKTNPLSRSERLRNYQTKPNTSGERWSSGISMVLHCRSRGATGSHPSVTLVARRKSDQRAGHLFRFASTPLALRLSGFALSQERAREGTYNRSVLTKRSQIDQADAGVREYRWCSTTGREARPALIRPSRRSQDKERPARRPPFSIRFDSAGAPPQRLRALARKSERRDTQSERFDETKPNRSGRCWSSGISMVLHYRSRGATGSHPSVTPVARQRATSAPATFFDSLRLRWRSASAASRSRKKEREKGHTIRAF